MQSNDALIKINKIMEDEFKEKLLEAFEFSGVNIKDEKGNFKSVFDLLNELAIKWYGKGNT
jgi:hypothetical protein